MKSNKGITMVSLIVYVMAMTIVIGIISTITISFYNNTNSIQANTDNSKSLTRFNQYMAYDINHFNEAEVSLNGNKLTLKTPGGIKVEYLILGDGIYRDKVKICSGIKQGTEFSIENIYDKTKIVTRLIIGDTETIDKTIEYILKD